MKPLGWPWRGYRIVENPRPVSFRYQLEVWRWWFPFWCEVYGGWTDDLDRAREIAVKHNVGFVVKTL